MTKPKPFTGRDLQAAREALERIRAQHPPEEHAALVDMVEILAELMALVSESDDDDTPIGEEFLALAIDRARARRTR
jgi:hypothetical protein